MSDTGEMTKNRFRSYRQKKGAQRLKGLHLASLSEDRRWKGKKAGAEEREELKLFLVSGTYSGNNEPIPIKTA